MAMSWDKLIQFSSFCCPLLPDVTKRYCPLYFPNSLSHLLVPPCRHPFKPFPAFSAPQTVTPCNPTTIHFCSQMQKYPTVTNNQKACCHKCFPRLVLCSLTFEILPLQQNLNYCAFCLSRLGFTHQNFTNYLFFQCFARKKDPCTW